MGTATSDPEAESTWADPEEVASAAAVSDDSSLSGPAASRPDPQLASADAVPQTADQRRAAALAAALERMQERNLAQQGSQLEVDVTMESGDAGEQSAVVFWVSCQPVQCSGVHAVWNQVRLHGGLLRHG